MRGMSAPDRSGAAFARRTATWLVAASLLAMFLVQPLHGGQRPDSGAARAGAAHASWSAGTPDGPATHDPDQCLLCRGLASARGALRSVALAALPAAPGRELSAKPRDPALPSSHYASSASPRAPPASSSPSA